MSSKPSSSKKRKIEDSDDSDVAFVAESKSPKKSPKTKTKTSQRIEISTSDESEDDDKPKKTKPVAKKPKVDAGEAKAKAKPNPKVWQKGMPRGGPPPAQGDDGTGSKEIPEGEPNCLAGLTFVFTGELSSLSREEAQNLAKKFGARVTGAPSTKTSYVVIGENAGPSKLAKIKDLKIKTVDEDGFLDLIGSRKAKDIDQATLKKQEADRKKIEKEAKAMPKLDPAISKGQLWTVKYAPHALKDICGNKSNVEKLQNWLNDWPKSLHSNFKKPGKDGMNCFRAILISGPPGIGKTTAAHMVAKLAGYSVIELNASDTRSKKLLEVGFTSAIDNTSLDGFMGIGTAKLFPDQPGAGEKAVLIMDEVDGMSGGDRGGVGALNALIKKTKIPIIAIANDASTPKMKPLANTCFKMSFRRPSAAELRARLMMIAFREGVKIDGPVIDQLVNGAQSDIRQIINMMSTYALSAKGALDFEAGKQLTAQNQKNQIQTPFTLIDNLFGPYTFSKTSRLSLNDKLDFYFQDFSAMPLFSQENYCKFKFARSNGLQGPELAMKNIELVQKAADSISEGDLMDALIHSSEQQWSLLPAHGIASTVRPAFFCYGAGSYGGYGGGTSTRAFPAWFGKNSTGTRLRNALGEVQIRMRLKVSGDRREIRQSYLPLLAQKLALPLAEDGQDGIDGVIELMDEYYLTKDEFDSVMEIGLEDANGDVLLKGVAKDVKAALTRTYNKMKHPIPFHKASDLGKAPKKMAGGERPDLEDIIELDEEVPDEDDAKQEDDDDDVSKDKLVKNKAKKPRAKKEAGPAAPKAKKATS